MNNKQPKIHDLGMLDVDYARMIEAEPVPEYLKQRLDEEDYDIDYISKQARRYRYTPDAEHQDDLLCKIALKAGLFTLADMEAIDDRTRAHGFFHLTEDERRQVVNWLSDELEIQVEDDTEKP